KPARVVEVGVGKDDGIDARHAHRAELGEDEKTPTIDKLIFWAGVKKDRSATGAENGAGALADAEEGEGRGGLGEVPAKKGAEKERHEEGKALRPPPGLKSGVRMQTEVRAPRVSRRVLH